jgi:hypothetical protein
LFTGRLGAGDSQGGDSVRTLRGMEVAMPDDEHAKAVKRLEQTLNLADQALSHHRVWSDQVRRNWNAVTNAASARVIIPSEAPQRKAS